MPKKGYKQTEDHKRKISEARKGMKFNSEHRKNLSLSHIGKSGYWTGKKRSSEDIEKFRKSHLGKKQSKETILKRIKKGLDHYNWQGGITPLTRRRIRGIFWKQIANEIRKRDNNICQICGLKGNGKKLPVHHIIPFRISKDNNFNNLITVCQPCHMKLENKKNCIENNLVTLCKICHSKTNANREYWNHFFNNKILT